MGNTWSQRIDPQAMIRRARGRAKLNSLRKFRSRLLEIEILRRLAHYGLTPGVQSRVARELGCHRSTVSKRLQHALAWRRE